MPKTIKELAQDMNCSYEAVRQQVKRYRHELSGHISYRGPAQTLDDYACAFLLRKRKENPISVVNIDRNDRIRELEDALQNAKDTIIFLQGEQNKRLEAENSEIKRLIAENAQQRAQLALIEEHTRKAVQEATEATKAALDELWAQEVKKAREEAQKAAEAQVRKIEDKNHFLENALQAEKTRKLTWRERFTGKKAPAVPERQEG